MMKNINTYQCSYCQTIGHKIHQCSHPSIAELQKEVEELTIFIYIFFFQETTNQTIKKKYNICYVLSMWLQQKEYCELKIIGYRFQMTTEKKETYLQILPKEICNQFINDNIYNKILEFSDAKLEKYFRITNALFKINVPEYKACLEYYCFPNHTFYIKMNTERKITKQINQFTNKNEGIIECECPICFTDMEDTKCMRTNCNHVYCSSCFLKYMWIQSYKSYNMIIGCPMCRENITAISIEDPNICSIMEKRFIPPPPKPIHIRKVEERDIITRYLQVISNIVFVLLFVTKVGFIVYFTLSFVNNELIKN
jgi:hypothetical protein